MITNGEIKTWKGKKKSLRTVLCSCECARNTLNHTGDDSKRDPPVPIPNTEVKPLSAECTWLETARENRTLPVFSNKKASERNKRVVKLDWRSLFLFALLRENPARSAAVFPSFRATATLCACKEAEYIHKRRYCKAVKTAWSPRHLFLPLRENLHGKF